MTIWQWAVCGFLSMDLVAHIRSTLRALPYYRNRETPPESSTEDKMTSLFMYAAQVGLFALLGYLWNL